jgi:hypothetical protein
VRIYQERTVGARRGKLGGAGCVGCLSPLLTLGLGCGITGIVFGSIGMSRRGSDAAAIEAFSQCREVVAALGTPMHRRPLSMGCGEYEGGGSSGDANWQITVQGPRGSASGWYQASYRNNEPWTVTGGSIELASGTVTLPCTPPSAAPQPRPQPAPEPEPERRRGGKRRGR